MTGDLTKGKPLKLIFLFSIPLLIGNIFQQFYNMADSVIVGRTIGTSALAAVGCTGAIAFLVMGFVQGMTSGFAVITAQNFGANKPDMVRRSVATSILLCIFGTVAITLVSVFAAKPLLRLMDTPEDIVDMAYRYIVVIFAGSVATIFYNLFSCVIRALGDSRTPLVFLIIASVLNIGLDFLFIIVFKMGVAGAGWATVLAQALSAAACLFYMRRRYPEVMPRRGDWKLDGKFSWQHVRVGLPMAFQFSITAIGIIVIQRALNSFGSDTIAAFTAASKIDSLATQALLSFGTAMATYTAQNFGAGEFSRIRRGVAAGTVLALGFSVFGAAIVLTLGGYISMLFVGAEAANVVALSQQYMYYVAGFYPVLGLLFIFRNTLQGMGYSVIPVLGGVAEVVMRVLAAIFLKAAMGYAGVCLASPIAWAGAVVLLIPAYIVIMKKRCPKTPKAVG